MTNFRQHLPAGMRSRVRQVRAVGPGQLLTDYINGLRFQWADTSAICGHSRATTGVSDCLSIVDEQFPGGITQLRSEITSFLSYARERSPGTAVEIGSAAGGNAFLLAQTLPSLSRLICVDLHVRNRRQLRALARTDIDIRFIDGSSQRTETHDAVQAALDGRSLDLLFIDGDHSFGGVFLDFFLYRSLLRSGGLIAFHDIVPDNRLRLGQHLRAYSGEVPALWARIKPYFNVHEFVEDWAQEGLGIGVLEHDTNIALHPLDLIL